MSIFDHITPSERAVELSLTVNRLRRKTGLDVVPMLVVEGATDEEVFSPLCSVDSSQVFAAGSRALVEQLLSHLKRDPIEGCDCVFLVDCDGRGKTVGLAHEQALLVTEACDLEADLISIGVAARVARKFLDSLESTDELVSRACDLALTVSVVRRAAHQAEVSMKTRVGRQLRIVELSGLQLNAWEESLPDDTSVLEAIASELSWAEEEIERVSSCLNDVRRDFNSSCMGKDALDVLFLLLQDEGRGEVRGWNVAHFYKVMFQTACSEDLIAWEVGRRLRAWEDANGYSLLH